MKLEIFVETFLCIIILLSILSCGHKPAVKGENPISEEKSNIETNVGYPVSEEYLNIETNNIFTTEETVVLSNKTKVLILPFDNRSDQSKYPNAKIVNTIIMSELYAFLYIVPSFDVPEKTELAALNSEFLNRKDIKPQDIYSNYQADIIIFGNYGLNGSKTDPTAQIRLNIWNKASGKIDTHEYNTPIDADIFDAIDAMLSQIISLTLNEEVKISYLNIGNFKIGNGSYSLTINNKPAAKITNDNFSLNLKILPNAIYSIRLRNTADNKNVLNNQVMLKPGETTNISYTAAFAEDNLYDVVTNGNIAFIKYYRDDINKPLDINGNTALILAIYGGDMNMIKVLIEAKADVNTADKDGVTALMWAAIKSRSDAVKALIEAKAGLNAADKDGWTALMWAARKYNESVMEALIEAKADLNAIDINGYTALSYAARDGDTNVVKILIEAKADLNTLTKNNETALMLAAQNGHTDVVKALIEAMADLNKGDNNGWTALMWAAQNRHTDIVKALIEAKTDVNKEDNNGWTVLMYSANSTITGLLRAAGAKQTIFGAAAIGDIDFIKNYSGDVNSVNKNGITALMWATQNGHTEAVKKLIAAGANVNAVDSKGDTALSLTKDASIINLLKKAGAK